LRGWTRDVVVFTNGTFDVPEEARDRLNAAGVRLETGPVARLVRREQGLAGVELASGIRVPCEALFAHPPQRQVELIGALGVALDDDGYVRIDPMTRETSLSGVYAAGDLTTRMQAAAVINAELTAELATQGAL